MHDEKPPSPGYLWRPGSAPQDNPLLLTVAIVIAVILVGSVLMGIVFS
jgi:hypothetical protein